MTEEGQRYFEQAQRLVAEVAEAESVVRGAAQQLSGWLRVAAAVGFGRMTLLPIVQRFLADSGLVARSVGHTRRLVVASRDCVRRHARGAKAPRAPADLLQHDCIVYTELATRNEWRFLAGPGASAPVGTAQSVRVSGRLQTNSSEVVRAAVLAGDGIGYSPVWLFGPELQSGEVVALLPDWQAPVLPMHLVSPPSRRHSAKVRLFGDFVAAGLAHEA